MPVEKIDVPCNDGWILHGHQFRAQNPAESEARGVVVIASATGVLASYYHRYATFLAEHGYLAITFDYRGIGDSAPESLKGFKVRWHDWGHQDIDAVLRWARTRHPELPLHFVGHSFGGFGVSLAAEARHLKSILTVGAQHAHWPDYARGQRLDFLARWHLRMPLAALFRGYFDGKRRGWLEDLPRGVALDWARSRKDFTTGSGRKIRNQLRANQQALRAPILALAATDDPFATKTAMDRTLAYVPHSAAHIVRIDPQDLGQADIGHFALFHSRFADTFWTGTLSWLADGDNPWSHMCERPHRCAPRIPWRTD